MASNIFVNPNEQRLRAFWRLLFQTLVFVAGMLIANIVVGMVLGLVLVATGNAAALQNQQALASNPFLRIFSSIGALVAMLVSYFIAGRWFDKRPFRGFGFRFSKNWWIDFAFGLFLGAILMVFIFGVERAAGWVTVTGTMQSFAPDLSFWAGIGVSLVVFFCVGIYEEMLSRGYELRNLAEGLNFFGKPKVALLLAYLLSSSVFGLLHLGNDNTSLISTINLIIAGLFLGLAYVLTGELAMPIVIHMTWNFFQGNVFGFPVSGSGTGASFIAIQQGGPDLWTGGAFGPEAGLIGLAAMVIGSVLIFLWVRMRYGKVNLLENLAIYQRPVSKTAALDQRMEEVTASVTE